MKVCPSCHSRFVGGEAFCPHDGEKLVDARELSPGELTGSKLDEVVRLDRLVYADEYGERYTGRLVENRRAVYVTVLNQGFIPDAHSARRAETARAKGGTPLPPQINTVLQLHLDHEPPFIVESEPRGPSIRRLLEQRRTLPWDDAVRLSANLARSAQWLHDQGVPHTGFHPGSIYVTQLDEGHVEVGDWILEAVLAPDSPKRQLQENAAAFVGYVNYMAPELIESSDQADIRSAVYSLGCLLYEMILGKPPLPAKTASETLKRHQHEKPVKLSIAYGGTDLPQDLDAILDMMLAKDPDKRFQAPMAVIGALSSLVDSTPAKLAPPLERAETEAEEDLYRTIDMESVDRAEVVGVGKKDKPGVELSTDEQKRLDEAAEKPQPVSAQGPVSGTSETRDDRDDEAAGDDEYVGPTHEMKPVPADAVEKDEAEKDAAEAADTDEEQEVSEEAETSEPRTTDEEEPAEESEEEPATDDPSVDQSKTLGGLKLGGSISDKVREDNEKKGRADGPKKTLLTGAGLAATSSDADEQSVDSHNTLVMGSNTISDATAGSGIVKKTKIGKIDDDATDSADEGPVDPHSAPTEETVQVQVDAETLEADAARSADGEKPVDASSSVDEDDEAETKSASEASGQGADTSRDEKDDGATSEPGIGFVEVEQDSTRDIDRSDWFASNTEDAWDASLAEEHEEQTEKRFRTILFAVIGLLVAAAAGLFIYSEWLYEEETTDEATAEAPDEDTEEVDLAALQTAFDESLESGRIVSPLGNSALHYLQQLKRHGSESSEYSEARETFVSTAREAAVEADEAGDLRRARALAGYASQFAPEDEELAAMVKDLQARFTGTAPEEPAETTDAGSDAADKDAGVDTGQETEEPPPEEPERVAATEQKEEQKKEPPKRKPPKKAASSGESVGDKIKKARIAYTRGDINTARQLYHEALKSDPNNAEVLFGLGKVYFDKSNYREAVKFQTKAVRYNGGRNDYRIALGQSYYRLGKYESAIGVWERVLERDPNNRLAKQYVMLARRKLEN